ncbi:MAG: hypothetical protein II891_04995 [Bacteroidales bacterium]|nr:hypothetical protein [Bacteroidales bacterium]
MKTRIISAIVLTMCLLISFVSCNGDSADGGSKGSGTSERTAIKGTPGAIGTSIDGIFTGGSAFMYKSSSLYHFLLCEGDAKNWKDAQSKPHLEINIMYFAILSDVSAVADISNALDINDPAYVNAECPVSVRWFPGNGMCFQGKYGYQGGANNYVFNYGRVMVANGPLKDMYTISFVGYGVDKDNNQWEGDWSYGGQFAKK